ncbi:MAG: hypothetical protein AAFZ99_02210 [Pseudomonadota bacterium]
MEYVKREPIKGASGREPTAFTMKTIKQLLAEDQTKPCDAETMRTPLPRSHVQQPPHLRGAVPVVRAEAATDAKPAGKPALKASAAPKIDAEMTAPPQALPKFVQEADPTAVTAAPAPVAAPAPAPEPEPKKRSLLGRLIGG